MSKKEDYNKTAKFYNQRYRETQFEKYRTMLSGLKLHGRILDHGCGTGLLSEFLGKELVGCDNSKEMLKIHGSGELADAEELPYKDSEFDFVLSFSVLMNCENPEQVIREAKRVLKEDGVFICTFLRDFKPELKPILEKYFKIKQELSCGEDCGFIVKLA